MQLHKTIVDNKPQSEARLSLERNILEILSGKSYEFISENFAVIDDFVLKLTAPCNITELEAAFTLYVNSKLVDANSDTFQQAYNYSELVRIKSTIYLLENNPEFFSKSEKAQYFLDLIQDSESTLSMWPEF